VIDSARICIYDVMSFQYFGTYLQNGVEQLVNRDFKQTMKVSGGPDTFLYRACNDYTTGCGTGGIVFNTSCYECKVGMHNGHISEARFYVEHYSTGRGNTPRHLTKIVRNEYDRKGNISVKKIYTDSSLSPTTIITYTYGKRNRLEKLSSMFFMNGQPVPTHEESFSIHYFYDSDKLVYKAFSDYASPEPRKKNLDSLCLLFDRTIKAQSDLELAEEKEDTPDDKLEKMEAYVDSCGNVLFRFIAHWPLQYKKGEELINYVYEQGRLSTVRIAERSNDYDEFLEPVDSFLYDDHGRVATHMSDWRTIYEYDQKTGKLIHIKRLSKETGKVVSEEWYAYDDKGRINTIRVAQEYGSDELELRFKYPF
jgi:hypothetical protein